MKRSTTINSDWTGKGGSPSVVLMEAAGGWFHVETLLAKQSSRRFESEVQTFWGVVVF